MPDGPSLLSLSAAGLYAIVVAGCLLALVRAQASRLPAWHGRAWSALGLLFIFLLAMRVTGLEETMRDSVRSALRAEGAFETRRDLQRVILAALAVAGGTLAAWLGYKALKGSRHPLDVAVKTALAAGLGLVGLLALRFVSLHAIDQVLYGPLKLNWVGDIGASLTVLAGSAYYWWRMRAFKDERRR